MDLASFFSLPAAPPKSKSKGKENAKSNKKAGKRGSKSTKKGSKAASSSAAAAAPPPALTLEEATALLDAGLASKFSGLEKDVADKKARLDEALQSGGATGKKQRGRKAKGKKKQKSSAAAPEISIKYKISDVTGDEHAVQLKSCGVLRSNALRPTLSRPAMIRFADPAVRATTSPPPDGPLGYLYPQVYTVTIQPSEEANRTEEDVIDCHFYGSWATQMSDILRIGDEVSVLVNCQNIFASDSGPHKRCICVGGPAEFNGKQVQFEDDVQVKVVSYPDLASGRSARAVEIGVDKDTVGTIPAQHLPVSDPYKRKRRSAWEPDDAKKAKKSGYQYTTISDLPALLSASDKPTANVYAVVLSVSPPRMTMRGEWCVSLSLFDESCDAGAADAVVLNAFNSDPARLPVALRAGDVLRCHRVGVQTWRPPPKWDDKKAEAVEQEAVVQLVTNKASSFVVLSRPPAGTADAEAEAAKVGGEKGALDGWTFFSTAKDSFSFALSDADRVRKLWAWAATELADAGGQMDKDKQFSLGQMNDEFERTATVVDPTTVSGDLTCLVCSVIKNADVGDGSAPYGFLRVWDGTGPSKSDPLPLESLPARDAVARGDPGHEAMKAVYEANKGRGRPNPPSLAGRVVNVAVWEAPHWEYVTSGWMGNSSVGPGSWVRLRNVWDGDVVAGPQSGTQPDADKQRMLMMHGKTALTPLPGYSREVADLLEEHTKRVKEGAKFNPDCTVFDPSGSNVPDKPKAAAKPAKGKRGGRGKKNR